MEIENIVDRVALELGERPVLVSTRSGQPRVGLTTAYAVHIAYDDRTRRRITEEADRLQWAAGCGVPVPAVEALTPEWLVTVRAVDDKVTAGRAYISAAIDAARAVSAASRPPPSVRPPVAAHGGGRRAGLQRLSRILRSPLSPAEFRRARAAAAPLPRDTLAHGDFMLHNILFDRSRTAVTIIDWEYLTYAPAHTDLLMLWPRLPEADDRDHLLDEVLQSATDRAALGTLHRWLAIRLLADLVTKTPQRQWDRTRIAQTVRRVAEARANATAWGA
ncbi:MAG: phosphotransferase [Acidimicrobiia bacterium]